MDKQFNVIKKLLTREEKKEIIKKCNKMGLKLYLGLPYKEFMENDVYDEVVMYICDKCGDTHEVGYDIIQSYLNVYTDDEYPMGICKKCGGNTLPLEIFNKNSNK